MACTMARGNKVCLAVPVLASIYFGLNSISESGSPGQMQATFPIHYVYGWLAAYFQTHFGTPGLMSLRPKMVTFSGEGGARHYSEMDARKRIFKGECASWLCTSRKNDKDFIFCDNNRGDEDDFDYFKGLRPCFLILRQGPQCIAEPYTPHRFSRQFGFYQAHAPGLLEVDKRCVSLTEGFRLYRQYAHSNSQSKATFPMNPTAPKKHYSNKYKVWLSDVHANLLENHVKDIIVNGNPNTCADGRRIQEQEDQLVASRKGKAPAQDDMPSHGQSSRQVAQQRREEQVRQRSSNEDVASDGDRHWKRRRGRPSNEVKKLLPNAFLILFNLLALLTYMLCLQDSVDPHVSNDAQSSNQHSSIGERQNSENPNFLDPEVVAHQVTPPSNTSHEEARPEPSQVTILPGAESFMSKYMIFIAGLWSDICEKLEKTPTESISAFKGSLERQLQFMKRDGVDLSTLEQRIAEFFKKAEDYDQARSRFSNAMPVETQVEDLCLAQGVLKEAQQEHSKTQRLLLNQQKILKDSDDQKTLLEEAIKEAEKVIKDSKEKLMRIDAQMPELQDLVAKAQEQHNTSQEAVVTAEREVKRIQDSPMLTEEDEEKLATIKKELEAYKEDLLNFRLL